MLAVDPPRRRSNGRSRLAADPHGLRHALPASELTRLRWDQAAATASLPAQHVSKSSAPLPFPFFRREGSVGYRKLKIVLKHSICCCRDSKLSSCAGLPRKVAVQRRWLVHGYAQIDEVAR